jgi:hypothetical protein
MGKVPQAPLISLVGDTLCEVGFYGGPIGRTALLGPVALEAHRPSTLPRPGETGSPPLPTAPVEPGGDIAAARTGGGATARPWTRRWGALLPLLSPLDSHARTHGSKAGPQHARHGARRDIEARRACISTERPRPWRAGVRPARVQAHAHLQQHALGSKAGSAQHGTRRGAPVRGAPLVAGPRPWRAWVRPAGSRAHQHLHQISHGTKAGSQQSITCPRGDSPRDATRRKGRSCTPGWRRDDRSAQCSTARRGVFPSLSCRLSPNPTLAEALGRRGLG